MNDLLKYLNEIQHLCAEHKVRKLYAFGSIVTGSYNNKSDVDLIVDFEPLDVLDYADNYYDLKFALQDIFHRPIDLLEQKALKNPYFKEAVNSQRQLIYGQ